MHVRATVTKRGSDLVIDLSDSHEQVVGFINSSFPNMRSAVVVALAYLIDPHTPKNDGAFRPLEVIAKPGHRRVGERGRAGHAVHQPLRAGDHRGDHQGAGAGLSGPRDGRMGTAVRIAIQGRDPRTDKPFIWHMFQARPGGGASPAGDGWPAGGEWQAAGGIKFGSLEVTEVRFPLFFRTHEFRPGSGGEGQYRGGPGCVLEMVAEISEPARGNTAGDGVKYGACGMLGGNDGLPHRYVLHSEDASSGR
ncbi:MAG: hydantoinase B/oxoprolinase family protein [Acetobacteraceae bacterium]